MYTAQHRVDDSATHLVTKSLGDELAYADVVRVWASVERFEPGS